MKDYVTRLPVMSLLLIFILFSTAPTVKGEGGQYFRVRPRNSSVLEGGEVTIPCEVGNRVGTVQWVKDGFAYVIQQTGEIVGHPRLRLIGDQNSGIYNLRITDASLTDDGEYQCQVGPYLRTKPIRANAHLIVICKSHFKSCSFRERDEPPRLATRKLCRFVLANNNSRYIKIKLEGDVREIFNDLSTVRVALARNSTGQMSRGEFSNFDAIGPARSAASLMNSTFRVNEGIPRNLFKSPSAPTVINRD